MKGVAQGSEDPRHLWVGSRVPRVRCTPMGVLRKDRGPMAHSISLAGAKRPLRARAASPCTALPSPPWHPGLPACLHCSCLYGHPESAETRLCQEGSASLVAAEMGTGEVATCPPLCLAARGRLRATQLPSC